jgi:hypothetical protein
LSQLRDQLLAREQGLRKEMDVEPSTSHPKASHGWEPGKCIPQSEKPPRYLISSTRVGEHTQFMREHALIGKFLGLWPSERDLTRWIKDWWNPKGDYEVQLSSKGFFTIILYNLEDKDKIFDNGPYFYNSVWVISAILDRPLQPRKGRLHNGSSVDQTILLASGVLAGRNPYGNREHSGALRQIIGCYKEKKIHLICLNLCVYGHLQSFTWICYSGISGRGLAPNNRLRTHPLSMQEMP